MLTEGIAILCPSRGRPDLLERMCLSAIHHAQGPVEILAMVDPDDPELPRYAAIEIPGLITFRSDGYPRVGAMWNALAEHTEAPVIMMGNDDLVFETNCWDTLVVAAANRAHPDGIWMAWCDDGSPRARVHAAFPIVSRAWIDALGYFVPECFEFFYHDTWVFDIAQQARRAVYVPDVLVEHRHFAFKKAPMDETYRRNRQGTSKRDSKVFTKTAGQRACDAAKITRGQA